MVNKVVKAEIENSTDPNFRAELDTAHAKVTAGECVCVCVCVSGGRGGGGGGG